MGFRLLLIKSSRFVAGLARLTETGGGWMLVLLVLSALVVAALGVGLVLR